MRNWWIRFGCFLTGHNYNILKNSSEVAAKSVKKYTSAILIVSIIWAFVGYMFTDRYLHGGVLGSVAGSVLMVVIIIQIERQIILSIHPGKLLMFSRMLIAGMMALLGAIIVDQIIFKEDIELEKMGYIQSRVDSLVSIKSKELRYQIQALDTAISEKEMQHSTIETEVMKRPFIDSVVVSIESKKIREPITSAGDNINYKERIIYVPHKTIIPVRNPKFAQLDNISVIIRNLFAQKQLKENMLLAIRPQLEKEITQKVGFLDELEIMMKLITRSWVAFLVWSLWFLFLFGLEMLVLISKFSEKPDDYGNTVQHQMNLINRKLELLSKMGQTSSI